MVSDCPVNFCVRNQFGTNMPGVIINISNDVGAVTTKHDIDCFGCTGQIGLACGTEYVATITPTAAYTCVECSKTFTPDRPTTIFFEVDDPYAEEDGDMVVDGRLTLVAPSVMLPGDARLSGDAPAGERVEIVVSKNVLGFDWLAPDTVLAWVIADADGTYTTAITLKDFGSVDVYARIKKAGWLGIDILEKDIVSRTSTIWVVTYPILLALGLMMLMVADKASGGKLRAMLKRR